MPDHVLGHEYVVEHAAVVHRKRVPHEVRHDHGASGPRLDDALPAGSVQPLDFLGQVTIDEGAFLDRSTHFFFLRSKMNLDEAFFLFRVL